MAPHLCGVAPGTPAAVRARPRRLAACTPPAICAPPQLTALKLKRYPATAVPSFASLTNLRFLLWDPALPADATCECTVLHRCMEAPLQNRGLLLLHSSVSLVCSGDFTLLGDHRQLETAVNLTERPDVCSVNRDCEHKTDQSLVCRFCSCQPGLTSCALLLVPMTQTTCPVALST